MLEDLPQVCGGSSASSPDKEGCARRKMTHSLLGWSSLLILRWFILFLMIMMMIPSLISETGVPGAHSRWRTHGSPGNFPVFNDRLELLWNRGSRTKQLPGSQPLEHETAAVNISMLVVLINTCVYMYAYAHILLFLFFYSSSSWPT